MTAVIRTFPATERVLEPSPRRALKEAICPSCGTKNRAAARFCIGCVGPLEGKGLAPAQEAPACEPHYTATIAFTRAQTAVERDRRWATTLARHALPEGTRIEGFQILRPLGEGGFGIVYLAWDPVLERHVAIKEYMPSSLAVRDSDTLAVAMRSERHRGTFDAGLRSFLNEARLLARFDHPALLKVFRFWEANGTAYMAMPYYEGPTLKEALAGEISAPSEAQLREWLHPLLDALAVLHEAQCLHRDISPDNIMLTSAGPVLLDFGAARRVISDMTQGLTAVLKPGFAPIEQYGGAMVQGPWTDLYALAGVIYYAITGRLPPASAARVVSDGFEPLAVSHGGRYSEPFLHAIDATLSLHPEARPQDVAQFRVLIDAPRTTEACQAFAAPVEAPVHVQEAFEAPVEVAPAVDASQASQASPSRASLETHGWTTIYVPPSVPAQAVPARPRRRIAAAALLALALAGGIAGWLGKRRGQDPAEARVPDVPVSVGRPAAAMPPPQTGFASPAEPVPRPAAPEPEFALTHASKPSAGRPTDRPALPVRNPVAATKPTPARAKPAAAAPETPQTVRRTEADPIPTLAAASRPQRCSDLVLKSSLDTLSSDEVTFQKTQCK